MAPVAAGRLWSACALRGQDRGSKGFHESRLGKLAEIRVGRRPPVCRRACGADGGVELRHHREEFVPILGDMDAGLAAEPVDGGELMIVALLLQGGPPREEDDRPAEGEGGDDRPHSRVRDDKAG